MAGRPPRWAAGLSLFVAMTVATLVWLAHRDAARDEPPRVLAATASASRAATTPLLHELEASVHRAGQHTGPVQGPEKRSEGSSGQWEEAVLSNARALRVRDFSLRYLGPAGSAAASGDFTAHVRASWRFAGVDRRPQGVVVRVRFAPRDGHLVIAGIGGGGRRSPLWLSGPLRVRRSSHALVLVQGGAAEADRVAALASVAVPQVRRVLPRWHGSLVVEVPATERRLEQALGADPGAYDGIAAVTNTVGGSTSRGAPEHVFVDPRWFSGLPRRSAQVVLTHEATHVATEAATSRAPDWLVEGFADYVALRPQRLPVRVAAARLLSLVQSHGIPARLPGSRAFDAGAPHLEARYESAWLACRLLARRAGQHALVAVYRAADGGQSLDGALHRNAGFGVRGLTQRWRTLLAHWRA